MSPKDTLAAALNELRVRLPPFTVNEEPVPEVIPPAPPAVTIIDPGFWMFAEISPAGDGGAPPASLPEVTATLFPKAIADAAPNAERVMPPVLLRTVLSPKAIPLVPLIDVVPPTLIIAPALVPTAPGPVKLSMPPTVEFAKFTVPVAVRNALPVVVLTDTRDDATFRNKKLLPALMVKSPVVVIGLASWPIRPAPPVDIVTLALPALMVLMKILPPSVPGANPPAVITPFVTVTGPDITGGADVNETAPATNPVEVIAPVVTPVPVTVTAPPKPPGPAVVILPRVTDPFATARTAPPLPDVELVFMATFDKLILPLPGVVRVNGVATGPIVPAVPGLKLNPATRVSAPPVVASGVERLIVRAPPLLRMLPEARMARLFPIKVRLPMLFKSTFPAEFAMVPASPAGVKSIRGFPVIVPWLFSVGVFNCSKLFPVTTASGATNTD